MFRSYAQNFEDVMLWRALKDVGRGFYVDVGAQDPVVDSVSMGFYEQGWRGVHVEPVAAYAELLRERRPDEVVIQAALGAKRGTLMLYELAGTGLSTAHREVAFAHGAAGLSAREVEVECLTLEQVLAPYTAIDVHWLKIDVEGYEHEVLAGWGSEVKPWIVVVESTLPGSQRESHQEWEPLVLAHGYVFAWFDGLNRYYVSGRHLELMRAFRYGPTVFDDFALSGKATASYCAMVNEEWGRQTQALDARAVEAQRKLDHAAAHVRDLERRLEESLTHGAAAEAHIAAMTGSASWRITAPLRGLRRLTGAGDPAKRASMLRDVVHVAKGSAAYTRVAPWVRERYPRLWSHAKQVLLDSAAPAADSASDRTGPVRASVGTSIPHNTGAQSGYDALAESGLVSAQELAALLEQEIIRQRKG
jgi:FkbM family methyltransferase